jgi:endonuclease/exonuclease/phosphatase family metal-dependent hydrolase
VKVPLYLLLTSALLGSVAAAAMQMAPLHMPPNNLVTTCVLPGSTAPGPVARLRVLTLNAAHGRRDSFNQLLLGKSAFQANLDEIGRLLESSDADIVALQEVDGPSRWSGGFDHAATIAGQAGYAWRARASHASSWLFDYGTAVLSRLPIVHSQAHRFAPSPPTMRKGFVISQVAWRDPAHPARERLIDVVSVHMDFLSKRARASQVIELTDIMSNRSNPAIVLGDFNSDWSASDSPVRQLATRLGLQAYQPGAERQATHNGQRLDWILLSPQLEFHSYRVLPDVVSDHRAVVAEIGISDTPAALPFAAFGDKIAAAAKIAAATTGARANSTRRGDAVPWPESEPGPGCGELPLAATVGLSGGA